MKIKIGRLEIVIIDYGMGNLRNVQKALEHIGHAARISDDPGSLQDADGIILPGVGAFGEAMDNLRAAGWVEAIHEAVAAGKPLLGICLGLQLLFEESEELGQHKGLGLLPGTVCRFDQGLKVPHIGWNQFQIPQDRARPEFALFEGIANNSYAYFVHSYYPVPADPECVLATTRYGLDFVSVVGRGNVFGAQPHPEKSQEVGLRLLDNFVRIVARASEKEAVR